MNNSVGHNDFNPVQFSSQLVNADKATEGLKKPEAGRQNRILQILNNTRLGRSLVKKQGWETFSANDLAVKAKVEGLTQELKEVNRQIKDTKRAIKPEITALHKELQKAKVDLAKTTREIEKAKDSQKKLGLNEKKQEIEQKIEGLKEKKKLLRQNEIQNLANLRQEWGRVRNRLTDLRKELKGTRLHRSSVVKSLRAAEQKTQNEFEDFASNFPGHHAFKASSLEQKIASNLKRIELYEELGVNPNKSEILEETQKYIVKLHVLSYKVNMSGETETAAQINQILTKLEAAFPDFAQIKDGAIEKGFAIRQERLKEGQNPPLFQNATKAEVDPSTFHSVNVEEAGETAVAKFCDKADNDFLFKIAGGIYNEDSGAVGQFEDGTGYVVVGDGEGSTKGNSVYWTHVLCEEVGKSLQNAHQALSFDPTDKMYTQGILQEALGK